MTHKWKLWMNHFKQGVSRAGRRGNWVKYSPAANKFSITIGYLQINSQLQLDLFPLTTWFSIICITMSYWWEKGTLLETIHMACCWNYSTRTQVNSGFICMVVVEKLSIRHDWTKCDGYQNNRIVPWQCSDHVVFINVQKTDTARQAANWLPILVFWVCPSQDDIVNTLSYQACQNHFVEQSSIKSHHNMVQYDIKVQCQKLEKCLQVWHTSYCWASWSFQMFTGPLFQINQHFLSTDLLSGFQSSPGALKSTE